MKRLLFAASFLICLTLLVGGRGHTAEGMYPLDTTSTWPIAEMKKTGMQIEEKKLLDLKTALAKVASGGSGSFVSARGLLVTNHHVAYRCIAALNGLEKYKGIMEKGFMAKSLDEEIPCPGYDLLVVDDVKDITSQIQKSISSNLKGHQRFEAQRLAREELETECQENGAICETAALDGGRFHHMMIYRRMRDVRLVYTPEKDIGKYGGDIDNWMYPRHTGDYAFLRAYVNRAGEGSPYRKDNVPFGPASYLKVSANGVKKGDFVLVMGFPAHTKRNFPSKSARFFSETDMATRKKVYGGMIEVLNQIGENDEQTKRRYMSLDAGLNNATKYYTQSMVGFKKWGIVSQRREQEEKIKIALEANSKKRAQFEKLLKKIDTAYESYAKDYPRHFYLTRIASMVKSLGTAYDIARWTNERTKEDKERKDAQYKTKNVYKIFEASDRLDDQITIRGEKALLVYLLEGASRLRAKERIKSAQKFIRWGKKELAKVKKEAKKQNKKTDVYYKELTGEDLSQDPLSVAVSLAYGRTALLAHSNDREERDRALFQRRRLFFNEVKKATEFKDPLLDFARDLVKEIDRLKKGSYRQIEETFETELRSQYAALIESKYPDANFQARLTYGIIDDYTATVDGKKHRYITDLAGVIAKNKDSFPFRVPPALKKQAKHSSSHRFADRAIKDIPVNFTTTLDTTGGNSGSPVLNAEGHLVGLLFDGTPESILSDWQFLPDDQRSICVDIRYALFLADTLHGAGHLLREMGL